MQAADRHGWEIDNQGSTGIKFVRGGVFIKADFSLSGRLTRTVRWDQRTGRELTPRNNKFSALIGWLEEPPAAVTVTTVPPLVEELPTKAEMFRWAGQEVALAREHLTKAAQQVRSDWVPENSALTTEGAAARMYVTQTVRRVQVELEEMAKTLTDAIKAERDAR